MTMPEASARTAIATMMMHVCALYRSITPLRSWWVSSVNRFTFDEVVVVVDCVAGAVVVVADDADGVVALNADGVVAVDADGVVTVEADGVNVEVVGDGDDDAGDDNDGAAAGDDDAVSEVSGAGVCSGDSSVGVGVAVAAVAVLFTCDKGGGGSKDGGKVLTASVASVADSAISDVNSLASDTAVVCGDATVVEAVVGFVGTTIKTTLQRRVDTISYNTIFFFFSILLIILTCNLPLNCNFS
jgi:hypothetical protein